MKVLSNYQFFITTLFICLGMWFRVIPSYLESGGVIRSYPNASGGVVWSRPEMESSGVIRLRLRMILTNSEWIQRWMTLEGSGQLRTTPTPDDSIPGRFWTTPDGSRRLRTTPDDFKCFRMTTPDSFRRFQTTLDNAGRTFQCQYWNFRGRIGVHSGCFPTFPITSSKVLLEKINIKKTYWNYFNDCRLNFSLNFLLFLLRS